jgi:hypothetical protein
MTKPTTIHRKRGRNDLCWCGSGKKYKQCHLPIEQQQQNEQFFLAEAHPQLTSKIINAAQTMPEEIPAAMEQFWQGKFTAEQLEHLDTLEPQGAERFLTWLAFDHVRQDGVTLVEHLASTLPSDEDENRENSEQDELELGEYERRLLPEWTASRLWPYVIEAVEKGYGIIVKDLFGRGPYHIKNIDAARRSEEGEVLVVHLVPVGTKHAGQPPVDGLPGNEHDQQDTPLYYLADSGAQLTADTREKFFDYVALFYADHRRAYPNTTAETFLRTQSFRFNHFVMALPTDVSNPQQLERIVPDVQEALQLTDQPLETLRAQLLESFA